MLKRLPTFMESAFIIDIVRTPVGKFGGKLATLRPDSLAAHVIKAIVARNPTFPLELVEDVIFGAANQAGEDNRNVARMAALLAQLPLEVGGVTVNRLCASGLQAIIDGSRAIKAGEGKAFLAGGVESMTRAPFVFAKSGEPWSRKAEIFDTTLGWRFINPELAKLHHPFSMGETAENVADKFKIARDRQDDFAFKSQQKYAAAAEAGKFKAEIVPVPIGSPFGTELFEIDEHPRFSTREKLATLVPAFKKDGTVTAGNSSGINDGAACCLLSSESLLNQTGITPMVRVVGSAVAGVDPAFMGIGPVPAVLKLLKLTGIPAHAIGLIELNEAFASQALACINELDLDPEIINVNGGAIAIGHPLGCSGVRISATLIHEMIRRKVRYGLATMCVGVGQGVAILYENTRI